MQNRNTFLELKMKNSSSISNFAKNSEETLNLVVEGSTATANIANDNRQSFARKSMSSAVR